MTRAPIPKRMRARCFELSGGRCEHCTAKLNPKAWECDHVDPWHWQQCHEQDNLQALCKPCHKAKRAMDVHGMAWVRHMNGEVVSR